MIMIMMIMIMMIILVIHIIHIIHIQMIMMIMIMIIITILIQLLIMIIISRAQRVHRRAGYPTSDRPILPSTCGNSFLECCFSVVFSRLAILRIEGGLSSTL